MQRNCLRRYPHHPLSTNNLTIGFPASVCAQLNITLDRSPLFRNEFSTTVIEQFALKDCNNLKAHFGRMKKMNLRICIYFLPSSFKKNINNKILFQIIYRTASLWHWPVLVIQFVLLLRKF